MYALLGIGREDKPARFAHLARNFSFFDAPSAFFCFVDRQMGPPQWSDLGMFLQTFMLLAEEAGLSTCAQEAWANHPAAVADFCRRRTRVNAVLRHGGRLQRRQQTGK